MIHSTKNDQYWLFWCQWWSDPQDQNLFWGNWHLEAVEATEVAEAAEINEAGEVSKGLKNHYCGLQKSSRFLNPIFWGLYFDVLKKKIFWQNLKNSYWILSSLLSEAVEAVWGQNKFIWLIRHKFPLLRKSLSISFWYICQNIWSSQVFTLCQNLMVDPVYG